MEKVAVERVAGHIRTNLAEYLEKGIVKYLRDTNSIIASTTWYVFLSLIKENVYFVKYITNNHAAGQYII